MTSTSSTTKEDAKKPVTEEKPKLLLYLWGCVDWTQPRDNAHNDLNLAFPTPHHAFNDLKLDIKSVSCGAKHTIVLTEDGRLFGFGSNHKGQLAIPNTYTFVPTEIAKDQAPFEQVSCGAFHTLALDSTGKIWSFGANAFGQLGNTPKTNLKRNKPVVVKGALEGQKIVQVCAGGENSYAVSEDGVLFTWGSVRHGALGIGNDGTFLERARKEVYADQEKPEVQRWLKDNNHKVKKVAAGNQHVLVLTTEGKLFTFGCGGYGRLGQGTDAHDKLSPVEVKWYCKRECLNEDILCGSEHSIALSKVGQHKFVYFWGRPGSELDGIMSAETINTLCGQPIKQVAAGLGVSMACTDDGELAIWGENKMCSQLGLFGKAKHKKKEPQVMTLMEKKHVVGVACGGWHHIALVDPKKSKGPLELDVPQKGRYTVVAGREVIPAKSWEDCVELFTAMSNKEDDNGVGEAFDETGKAKDKKKAAAGSKKRKKEESSSESGSESGGESSEEEQPKKKAKAKAKAKPKPKPKAKKAKKKKLVVVPLAIDTKIKVWMEDEFIDGSIVKKLKPKNKYEVKWDRAGWKNEGVELKVEDNTDDEENIERWQIRDGEENKTYLKATGKLADPEE
eukprot:TRINITY_DN15556_c0_g1_i1.p1 TRINITY_DN15556_c0_g1~~TRINITY_DN15556_c0_g1_i1.p1  ORF type:complete len:626 (-),score=88.87 TRINITY_DN15556_c0_g1_i1:55-1911(-)